jgi:hypothetical protein
MSLFPHQVTRLVFDTGQPYEEFRARYEVAVPALDEKRLAELASFGLAAVTGVGIDLDRKLAALLGALDIPVGETLDSPPDKP